MGPIEIVAIIFELIAWFGVPLGVLLLFVVFVVHAFDGGWERTEIVLVDTPRGRIARWFAGHEFFERSLQHDEHFRVGDAEAFAAYTARNKPEHMQLDPRRPSMQLVRFLGFLFLGIGLIGVAGAFVFTLLA